MDPTVPRGAATLLDFIGDTEAPEGYGTICANKQSKLPVPLTEMTLGEVIDAQSSWSRKNGSSAAGRYQFMKATLQDLSGELGLRGDQVFEHDLQDRLGYHLLKRRGYAEFMAGEIDTVEFGKRLAMEWASMPVLSACRGAHRSLQRGQSFYAGDALNKALVRPERFAAVIRKAYEAEHAPSKPVGVDPRPSDPAEPSANPPVAGKGVPAKANAALVAGAVGLLAAVAAWAGDVWHWLGF